MGLSVSTGGVTRSGSDNYVGSSGNYLQGGLNLSMPSMGGSGGGSGGGSAGRGGGGVSAYAPQGYVPKNLAPWIEQDANSKFAQDFAQNKQAFDQAKFQTVWGGLQGLMGQLGGGFATPGGQSPASPEIGVGGVFSPQQIDQQVNASRAKNDATTASRMRDAQTSTASRGFGSNSPLLMALQGRLQNQNLATNADSERDIRMGGAEKNAQHLLDTQQAREQQFASRNDEDIRRRQPYFGTANALISALAGLA